MSDSARIKRTPAQSSNTDQRRLIGLALHADLTTIIDAWPQIQHVAYTQGGELPSGGNGLAPPLDADEEKNGRVTLTAVERLAIDRRADLAQRAVEWFAHFTELMAHLATLANEGSRLVTHEQAPDDAGEPCCVVHEELVNRFVPASKDARCSWCYGFRQNEGVDPTAYLLSLHDAGRRVTTRLVADELGSRRRRGLQRRVRR